MANQDGWSAYVYESRKLMYMRAVQRFVQMEILEQAVKAVLLQFYNIESKNYNSLELNKNVETVIIY